MDRQNFFLSLTFFSFKNQTAKRTHSIEIDMRAWVTWAGETKSKFEKWIFLRFIFILSKQLRVSWWNFFHNSILKWKWEKFFNLNLWFLYTHVIHQTAWCHSHFDCILFKNKGHVYDVGSMPVMDFCFINQSND